jgi:D-aspartate ligase
MKKEFMAVLLGSDDNVYGFARSFHKEYNIKPIALATAILEPTKNSNIVDVIVDKDLHDEKHLVEKLIEMAKKLKIEYKKLILIPCSDAYMEMVVKHQDELKMYENRFIDFKHLKEFNDKESFYKMCDKYNMPYPKTYVCSPKDYKKVLKTVDLDYPLILKPNNSNSEEYLNASFEGKEKVYFINDYETLLDKIEKIYSSSYQDVLIIQKYVTGDDTNMRVLNVYVDKNGKVKMMCLGQPILEEYHPKTYGNYASIISLKEHIPIMDDIKKFLEEIGYRGTANFDIKKDELTGKYYLFEINPRPGRSSFFTACAGKSLASCYVEDLIYGKVETQMNAKEETLWLNVPFVLVKKYVKNEDILNKAKELKKSGKAYHTLRYDKDSSLKRKYICELQYLRKIHYYPKYYIEKK